MNNKEEVIGKHFAVLGKLESKFSCPYFEDKTVCIISMNAHWDSQLIPRVDLWFDLHEIPEKEDADFTKENFPFDQCHELVKGRRFCTTAAYLIAWCVLQGATRISLYGMKFEADGNPRRQRELHNVREMIFFCLGRNIEIEIGEDDVEYLFPEHINLEGQDFDQ